MRYENHELREALAAEHALGLLRGPARDRFVRLMHADPTLQALARDWEMRLNELAEATPPIEPSPLLWSRIEAALGFEPERPRASPRAPVARVHDAETVPPPRLWERIAFWRGIAFAASAAAAALLFYVFSGPVMRTAPAEPTHVAVLEDPNARPAFLAEFEMPTRRLTVRALQQPPVTADQALELWLVPPEGSGAPQSLGLVTARGMEIELAPGQRELLARGALAVSQEPAGGSPTGAPTGPVLYVGPVQPLL